MPKENKITIDLNEWTTQAKKAELTKRKLSTISQQVVRSQQNKTPNPVEYWTIEELGLTLVKKSG